MGELKLSKRDRTLKRHLEVLLQGMDTLAYRDNDPVSWVHRVDPEEREIVGLIASCLAFGRVASINASIGDVMRRLSHRPTALLKEGNDRDLRSRLDGFVHRLYRGSDLATVLILAARLRSRSGSLGAALAERLGGGNGLQDALASWSDALRGENAGRGLAHLIPDPRKGSACKRQLLYLRWMARPADGVDLGLWPISASRLLIPVDTHILRISKNLGLTKRSSARWRTSEEITERLRRFDPKDPVRYDFALCHLGISQQCPSRREAAACAGCALRASCVHWRR